MILERADNIEMGLKLLRSERSPDLWTGMTRASFQGDGKTEVVMERLMMWSRWGPMTWKHRTIANSGTPSTPTAREELIELMASDSSGRVTGLST